MFALPVRTAPLGGRDAANEALDETLKGRLVLLSRFGDVSGLSRSA